MPNYFSIVVICLACFCSCKAPSLSSNHGNQNEPMVELWIELGQPDEKRLRKACRTSERVNVYCYQGNSVAVWWPTIQSTANRLGNLTVFQISDHSLEALEGLAQRQMDISVTIHEGEISVTDGNANIEIELHTLTTSSN